MVDRGRASGPLELSKEAWYRQIRLSGGNFTYKRYNFVFGFLSLISALIIYWDLAWMRDSEMLHTFIKKN